MPDTSQPDAPTGRVAFICQSFHPDKQAAGRLFTTLFEAAARVDSEGADVDVEIVCGFPTQRSEAAAVRRRDTFAGFALRRLGLPIDVKRNLVTRALSYAAYLVDLARFVLTVPAGTALVCVTSPPFAPMLVWLLTRVRRLDYAVVVHDIYPDILVRLGHLRPGSILARVWHALTRLTLTGARAVVALGRDMRDLLVVEYRLVPTRVHVIPNWNVLPDIEPIAFAETEPIDGLDLHDRVVVQYAGNMGILHDIDTIVRAADRLRERPEVHFLLVGAGMRRAGAERLAADLALGNVTFMDYIVDDDRVWNALCACHISLISLRSGLSGVAVPSKLYMSLASGRPIVAQVPEDSEPALVVSEEDAGIVVAPGDVDGLAATIGDLVDDPALRRRLGKNARRASVEHYDVEVAAQRYLHLFETVRRR